MQLGLCSTDLGTLPMEPLFSKIRDFGCTSVQLSLGDIAEADFTPSGQLEIPESIDGALPDRIARSAQARGLKLVALNGTYNMAHPEPSVREEGVRRFALLARAARAIDCPVLTLCSGTRNAAHLWRAHADNGTVSAWNDMLDSLRRLVDIAERYDVTLAIETEAANIIDTPEKARAVLDAVASKRLRMILDCANLFRKGEAQPENVRPRIQRAFECFGKDIVLAHGKDIRAGADIDFCATGEGIIDYPYSIELLRVYGYTGSYLLHGIYDDAKIESAVRYIAELLSV